MRPSDFHACSLASCSRRIVVPPTRSCGCTTRSTCLRVSRSHAFARARRCVRGLRATASCSMTPLSMKCTGNRLSTNRTTTWETRVPCYCWTCRTWTRSRLRSKRIYAPPHTPTRSPRLAAGLVVRVAGRVGRASRVWRWTRWEVCGLRASEAKDSDAPKRWRPVWNMDGMRLVYALWTFMTRARHVCCSQY